MRNRKIKDNDVETLAESLKVMIKAISPQSSKTIRKDLSNIFAWLADIKDEKDLWLIETLLRKANKKISNHFLEKYYENR